MTGLATTVREEFSRWIMRSIQAGRVLRLPLLGVTAVSTLTTALRGTAAEQYTAAIVGAFMAGSVVFIWAYDRFQILNYENRHKMDRSDNFAGPGMAMGTLMRGRQLAVLGQGLREDWSSERIQEEMQEATLQQLREWRDGIDLDEVYNGDEEAA
ncbi:MAG: hypothetical protein SVW02_01225 [Candidatus Nanohaloarchaea archaeon]|nr:hypothetical protein [Candidatus Nanohaloarchaea archaeon]